MLNLSPVPIALPQARETELRTAYGSFYARTWASGVYGWLSYVVYRVGTDVEIHRNSPGLGMSEADAATWIHSAYEAGPHFLLPLLEAAND